MLRGGVQGGGSAMAVAVGVLVLQGGSQQGCAQLAAPAVGLVGPRHAADEDVLLMVVAAVHHVVVGSGDTGAVGSPAPAGAAALFGGNRVVGGPQVPVAVPGQVLETDVLGVFQADHAAQGLEEGAAEARQQAEGNGGLAYLQLLIGAEAVADPGVLGEGDVAHPVGVFEGVGIAVEAVLGGGDPAVRVVVGGEEEGVEAELGNVPVGVVVQAPANGATEVEVIGDLHGGDGPGQADGEQECEKRGKPSALQVHGPLRICSCGCRRRRPPRGAAGDQPGLPWGWARRSSRGAAR
ncbi:hypothetical protein D3C84_479230 [compost metagenome]